MLPLLHTLRFGRFQHVSLLVILACLMLFIVQQRTDTKTELAINNFCGQYDPAVASTPLKTGWPDRGICRDDLRIFAANLNAEKFIENHHRYGWHDVDRLDDPEVYRAVKEQVDRYLENAPFNLTKWLMYYPNIPNPLQMISSNLIHADLEHIFFNLLFFFPFAMMLEPAIQDWRRYLGTLLMITLAIGTANSMSYLIGFSYLPPIPSLGLSGIVMGVMGLSAYLIPRARILILTSFTVPWTMPLWTLTVWYLGWDIVNLCSTDSTTSNINFLAHVIGGLTGYALGPWWFSERKTEIRDELNHAIDSKPFNLYMIHQPMSPHLRRELEVRDQHKIANRGKARFTDTLYHLNQSREFQPTHDYLQEYINTWFPTNADKDALYETVNAWSLTKFRVWFALQTISRRYRHGNAKGALSICEEYLEIYPDLVLEEPLQVIPLARLALKLNKPAVAFALLHDCELHYEPGSLDTISAALLEAESLAQSTGDYSAALRIARGAYAKAPISRETEARQVINSLEMRQRKISGLK